VIKCYSYYKIMARKLREYRLSKEQQKLAHENINLARREAWKLQRTTDIDYDTLEGAALEGLCKAAYRYDPSSGFKFSSLAVPTIRGELLHWIRDRTYAMRLTHRMRENWIKGRRMMYRGLTDEEVAVKLEVDLTEWLEIKGVCSGPPLELNDQAKPTESLEPDEINFAEQFIRDAHSAWELLGDQEKGPIMAYLKQTTNRLPSQAMKDFMIAYEDRVKIDSL
jgi:DNA-directed RNA polymerase specialized sigma subunit